MNVAKSALALVLFVAFGGIEAVATAQPAMPEGGGVDPNPGTGVSLDVTALPESERSSTPSKEALDQEMRRRLQALDGSINRLLSIPQTPAAFAIGTTGEAVARPGTLRDAALQLVTLYDANGDLKPGFSGEFAPFRLLNEDQTLEEWQKSATAGSHVLDTLRLSLATAADPSATGPNAPVLVSIGVRFSFLDDRDYRRNPAFVQAVRKVLSTCFPARVEAAGGGINEGAGFTRIDSSEACASAQRERNSAQKEEALLRQKVADTEKDQQQKALALKNAQSELKKALESHAIQEGVLKTLEARSADPASVKALKPFVEAARSELVKATSAVTVAQQAVSKSTTDANDAAQALSSLRAEHESKLRSLALASAKVHAMNDGSDFVQLQHDLETQYLSKGSRLELAVASVLADRGIGDGGAQYRQSRGFLAYEYGFGKGSVGAATDLMIIDNRGTVPNGADTLVDWRLGARMNFSSGGVDTSLAAGLATRKDRSDAAEYGGTVELKLGALGAVRTGLHARTPFDDSATELIAILAVSTASGESILDRAYSSNVK